MLRQPKALKSFQSPAHARSRRQEEEVAGRLGGKRVKGSGSGFEKGDVRVKGIVRVETKTTIHDSFRVTREMLGKIERAGLGAGEIPVMVVEFLKDGKPDGAVAVVPEWALASIVGAVR